MCRETFDRDASDLRPEKCFLTADSRASRGGAVCRRTLGPTRTAIKYRRKLWSSSTGIPILYFILEKVSTSNYRVESSDWSRAASTRVLARCCAPVHRSSPPLWSRAHAGALRSSHRAPCTSCTSSASCYVTGITSSVPLQYFLDLLKSAARLAVPLLPSPSVVSSLGRGHVAYLLVSFADASGAPQRVAKITAVGTACDVCIDPRSTTSMACLPRLSSPAPLRPGAWPLAITAAGMHDC